MLVCLSYFSLDELKKIKLILTAYQINYLIDRKNRAGYNRFFMQYKGLTLDSFQAEAIRAIDQQHSVVVTAPTGAGKTIIAEYAVERCIQSQQRIIYTAPIKALSNQKYRDFLSLYGEQVGILTGDVVINQFAPVLIMTTEIFRNTIFDNISRLSDVSYVVFDEVHFINDSARGTVWEESLIFAPQHIKFICLSATISNIDQFSGWMNEIREIPITVVEEIQRPVPLEHSLYIERHGLGNISDLEKSHFNDRNFDKSDLRKYHSDSATTNQLIQYVAEQGQLPCLYFCFSRKRCEANAQQYASGDHFFDTDQRTEILTRFDELCRSFNIYSAPNVVAFRKLVRNGVAYHHAGMLPTLKEVVERLFTFGLIQLLFTTETFAVGINMPACTVIFDSLEKYDGVSFRYLKAQEYHQMAGRAGRRGIDEIGYTYAKVDPQFADVDQVQSTTLGSIEPIKSQFNLSYNSVLNLCNKYQEQIYEVCTQSLSNYQNVERIQQIDRKLKRTLQRHQDLEKPSCINKREPTRQIKSYIDLVIWGDAQYQKLKQKEKNIRRQERGRKRQGVRRKRFAHLNQEREKIKHRLASNLCHHCDLKLPCKQLYEKGQQVNHRFRMLETERERVSGYQKEQIQLRLNVLRELGYIDQHRLLARGQVAAQINGYEMQITELLFSGLFEELNEDEINVLLIAIVCERRKERLSYVRMKNAKIRQLLDDADQLIGRVRFVELESGFLNPLPRLETTLSTAMWSWSRGCKFETLKDLADLSDGDFVRAFRMVIDLLRQMKRAFEAHLTLIQKLDRCIDKINRDVIDAERQLRIGNNMAIDLH